MGKRILIFITVVLVSAIAVGWYFFSKESKYFGTSSLKAVPVETPFFLRIRNIGELSTKAFKTRTWKVLSHTPGFEIFCRDLECLDSLLSENKGEGRFFLNKELILVPTKRSRIYLLEMGSINEKNKINDLIRYFFRGRVMETTKIEAGNVSVQGHKWVEKMRSYAFYTSFYKGTFIAGGELEEVKAAILQLDKPSILDDSNYIRINKNATENIDLNLFINHNTFAGSLSTFLTDSLLANSGSINFAKWTEVDILFKENQLLLNGFSVTDSLKNCYLDVFRHQIPRSLSLDRLMPSTVTYYQALNLSDPVRYFDDYLQFLRKSGNAEAYQDSLQGISLRTGLDLKNFFSENWLGEAAVVYCQPNLENSSENRFLLLKIKKDKISQLINSLAQASPFRVSREKQKSELGGEVEMPFPNFGEQMFGSILSGIKTEFIVAGEEFVLMGSNAGALARYIGQLRNREVLADYQGYKNSQNVAASSANFQFWASPDKSLPFFNKVFADSIFHRLSHNSLNRDMPENCSWQFGTENGTIYNTANVIFNSVEAKVKEPYWSYKHPSKITRQPVFVTYSIRNNVRLIVFEDSESNLVALDKEGQVKWKRKLDGTILGAFQQTEMRQEGEFQLLFNTKNSIYLLDSNGKSASGFPIKLKVRAINPVSVFDYDKNKDYRFLIACNDFRIYNFDRTGKLIKGWQPPKMDRLFENPVLHYRISGKDYVVVRDKKSSLILDRQGKDRSKNAPDFSNYRPEIITGVPSGSTSGLFVPNSPVINRLDSNLEGNIYLYQSNPNEQ